MKIRLGRAGSWPHYVLEMTALKGVVRFQAVSVLRSKICWVVAPCVWVISFRRFEQTYRLHPQGQKSEYRLVKILRNVGMILLNQTAQKLRRFGPSAITLCKPQYHYLCTNKNTFISDHLISSVIVSSRCMIDFLCHNEKNKSFHYSRTSICLNT